MTFQLPFFPGCGSVHHAICQQRPARGRCQAWFVISITLLNLAAWGISFCPNIDMRSGFLRLSPISLHGGIGVYVHCNGGKGRSAVCVICYLARILAAVWFEGVGVSGDKTVQGNTATAMAMEPIMRFWMEINGDNLYFSSNMGKIWKFVDILLPLEVSMRKRRHRRRPMIM